LVFEVDEATVVAASSAFVAATRGSMPGSAAPAT
jgi:hypothetical protein